MFLESIAALTMAAGGAGFSPPPTQADALLNELQKRAVTFFWNESHPVTGFTKDRAANLKASDTFDVSSVAATGFALAAYPIGVERRWIPRPAALERTRRTLHHLLKTHDHRRGWFAHFVNWETGERVWRCEYSTIDTAILLSGLLVAEAYWKDPQVTRDIRAIYRRVDWKWAMTDGGAKPDEVFFSHGWRPEAGGFLANRWDNYSEEGVLYLPAFGSDPALPTAGWDRMRREWASYEGIDILRGGPLFIHQMAAAFFDFSDRRDRSGVNYWVATRNAILANRAYCITNPQRFKGYGPDFWGLSAADGPDGYNAFGAPHWISDNGTVTPSAGIGGVLWTPEISKALAVNLAKNYGYAWGRYGFSVSLNPHRDWVSPDVIGIELGQMALLLENHRSGMIHRLTNGHPVVREGFRRAGFRRIPNANAGPLRVQ